ncbi:hypothetical protein [Amycolatopsis anabasis]|uniref:hypothetical protein n=1 Tax=Amycolatopsis anabasis TaxID=1840409 RepID=UPI00131DF3B4|nr:hypothetical protein [Amycolatopsis anabasis]
MNEHEPKSAWAAESCTLPTEQQPLREAEFDALFATAVRALDRPEPTRLTLTLAGGADVEETVRDLVRRETECCTFFTFDVTRTAADRLRLDIGVPANHREVLDALAERAGRR